MALASLVLIAVVLTRILGDDGGEKGCPLADTRFGAPPVGLTDLRDRGCALVNSDTGRLRSPRPLWGAAASGGTIDCESRRRQVRLRHGGDPHPTGLGEPQPAETDGGFGPFRRLTVRDGDDVWGERCELGHNEHRYGEGGGGRAYSGTFALYPPDQRRVTFASIRLPENFPLAAERWQTVLQMKHANPSQPTFGGHEISVPAIGLEARSVEGRPVFRVYSNEANPDFDPVTFAARKLHWIRFVFDVFYSSDPERGWLQVSADLDGDGDLGDPGEVAPKRRAATLVEQDPDAEPIFGAPPRGQTLAAHLRIGLYHDPQISCPPAGCSVDVDNVQVVANG